MSQPVTLNAIDVFAGCGGLSVGLKRARYDVVFAVELEPEAAATYALNHPNVDLLIQDVRTVNFTTELARRGLDIGELDLLAACPPCQGFSTMRTWNGHRSPDDDRNDLVLAVARLVTEIKPKNVLFENVPGLARDVRFMKLLRRLENEGYSVAWEIADAANFGVPQHRKRLVLLASRIGQVKLPLPKDPKKTVRATIGSLPAPAHSKDPLHRAPEKRSAKVMRIMRAVPHDGGSRSELPADLVLRCHKHTSGFKDVYGRLAWDEPSNTITSGCTNPSKGRFLHPVQDRALTLREASLLQGFPRRYKFPNALTKTSIALQIGNAIPPRLAQIHAKALADILSPSKDQ